MLRRMETVGSAHKERVSKECTQSAQRVADRRLAEAEILGHIHGPAVAQ
jgi:hypothetical protein